MNSSSTKANYERWMTMQVELPKVPAPPFYNINPNLRPVRKAYRTLDGAFSREGRVYGWDAFHDKWLQRFRRGE